MGDRRSRFQRLVCALICLTSQLGVAQLTPAERQGIADALFLGNLQESGFKFERKLFHDPYRLPLVDVSLDDPIKAADELLQLHASARTTPLSSIAEAARRQIWSQTPPVNNPAMPDVAVPQSVPGPLRKPLIALIGWVQVTNAEIRRALSGITPEEKRALIDGLPNLAVEEPGVKFDFVKGTPLGKAQLLAILKRVDTARISRAGSDLCLAIERIVPQFKQQGIELTAPIDFRVDDVTIRLAGAGDDRHIGPPPAVIVDLGGNDRYEGRVAAGIGFASVLIDLGGDDRCASGDLAMGAGLLGVGVAKFGGGSSVFQCGSLSCGSGLAGFGVFAKEGSDDSYRSTALSQGFGMFGVGIMIDNAGNDTYRLGILGQGAAKTSGVGWLIDRRGRDLYQAGGLVVNSPLFQSVTYSFAQGFGSGYREDSGGESGGIGLITDFAGDDLYLSDTYAQAASYWFAMGSLYDAAGNDTYSGYHYVQSSAMHLTAAFFFDLEGDDGLVTKFGACHAIGHDYGVAFLLDRAGNDVFASQDSNPGTGNANGVGIFLDAAGNDRYSAAPGLGNAARGTGSIGLFVDLAGADKYREGLSDGTASATTTWGIALDQATAPNGAEPATNELEWPKPSTAPMRTEAEMAKLYARASQWGVGTAQSDVEKALREIVAIGMPAWEWILAKRAETADHLQIRAIGVVLGQLGTPARAALAQRLETATEALATNLMRIATQDRTREAGSAIAERLKSRQQLRTAVKAAGACGGEECVRELLPLCIDEDPVVAETAVIALADIGSETGYSTAEAVIQSPDVLIRRAAIRLMAGFPSRALITAKRLLGTNEEKSMRLGLELIGATGTQDALNEACKYLSSGLPGVKIQALLALAGRCPADSVAAFRSLKSDPNPIVKALASRLVPTK